MEESVVKALNSRYINLTKDVSELIEGVKARKLGKKTNLLSI
jgi:hypothetical protein